MKQLEAELEPPVLVEDLLRIGTLGATIALRLRLGRITIDRGVTRGAGGDRGAGRLRPVLGEWRALVAQEQEILRSLRFKRTVGAQTLAQILGDHGHVAEADRLAAPQGGGEVGNVANAPPAGETLHEEQERES